MTDRTSRTCPPGQRTTPRVAATDRPLGPGDGARTPAPAMSPGPCPRNPPRTDHRAGPAARPTRARGLAVALALAACADDPLAPTLVAPLELRSPCPGSDEAFAFRALRLLEGRRPYGVRELAFLADTIATLDAAGLPGRAVLARGLASGERWIARWRTFLFDHLRVPRLGGTAFHGCTSQPGPAADDDRLARHVRDHDPTAPVPADLSPATLADLLDSSLRLDDLTPVLRAHLLTRQVRPVGGNNVDPADLERSRRLFLGRSFEAGYLGRRLECLACHDGGGATPTDSDDPRLDRTWPVKPDLEARVFGPAAELAEDRAYAAFRVDGFIDGPLRPWGLDACGGFDPARAGDPLGVAGHLAGPLPPGAHALDLEARLRAGFDLLRERGLDAADDPAAALAAMVALHLADAVWAEASGRPLTLAHGQPRNEWQRTILADLAGEFVDRQFSLRALLVAVATHPALDLAEPAACAGDLAPILDPFVNVNTAGDGLRREDPWRLLDGAAEALGWRLKRHVPVPYGWEDEPLVRALGVFLDESEPGHRGVDLVGALAWEQALGPGVDPGWQGDAPLVADPAGDVIARLVALARADPAATVEDLAIALQDRLIQETAILPAERPAIEPLLALPLAARAADHPAPDLEAALRRFAGALLASPQFQLAGLPPPPAAATPRLVLPETTPRALCQRHAPALLADHPALRWRCDDQGLVLEP